MLGLTGDAKDRSEEEQEDVPGMPKRIDKAVATVNLKDARLDVDIPGDRFAFKPESGVTKVAEFDWDGLMEMPDPQSLVGKPAPTFGGDGLDGKPLSLEGLRDRIVVLDFWATWCVPCVQTMPQVQKVAERFANQPVSVVGVNQDSRGSDAKVKKFLEDKKIAFRQFLDPAGKLGRKYKVAGIPCTFLIDKKGTVQAVRVGFQPDGEEELAKQVEKLLKGENLYDAQSLPKNEKE